MKNPFNFYLWVLTAIVLCALALYCVPLQSKSFQFDDYVTIANNEVVKKIDIPAIFGAFNTRFLVGLSFALNYKFCTLHPEGYRLINLLIHCLNAFLVYLLVKYTLPLVRGPSASLENDSAVGHRVTAPLEWPAIFASMLFLCHPIQTEPINFITQRFVLMGTLCYLLTLYLYIRYRVSAKKRYLAASMASAMAAMFCKEFVVTLPIMLALYEFYFLGSFNETIGHRSKFLIPFFVIVLIVPFLLLRTPRDAIGVANIADSTSIQEGDAPRFDGHIDITRAHGAIDRKQYFLTELNVVCTYVRLLFVPVNQNFDYDYPVAQGMDKKTVLCGLFLFCLLVLAAVTYESQRLVSFGILWFFIALSVESSLIPIGHVIAEYRLYLASVGFAFLITSLIYTGRVDVRKLNMVAALILIVLSFLTFQRNKVWKDTFSLWNDTVQKSPHKARPYNNRGNAYCDQGKFTLAMADYDKAISLDPQYSDAYYDRAIIYNGRGDVTQALSDFSRAVEINPEYVKAYIGRGISNSKLGHLTESLSDFNMAIKLNPGDAQAVSGRGIIYFQKGDITRALSDFSRAIAINPQYVEAYTNRATVYILLKEYGKARADVHKAQGLGWVVNPNLISALNNTAN